MKRHIPCTRVERLLTSHIWFCTIILDACISYTVFLTVARQYEEAHIVDCVDHEEHGLLPSIPIKSNISIIPGYIIFCVGAIYSNDGVYSATVLRQLLKYLCLCDCCYRLDIVKGNSYTRSYGFMYSEEYNRAPYYLDIIMKHYFYYSFLLIILLITNEGSIMYSTRLIFISLLWDDNY